MKISYIHIHIHKERKSLDDNRWIPNLANVFCWFYSPHGLLQPKYSDYWIPSLKQWHLGISPEKDKRTFHMDVQWCKKSVDNLKRTPLLCYSESLEERQPGHSTVHTMTCIYDPVCLAQRFSVHFNDPRQMCVVPLLFIRFSSWCSNRVTCQKCLMGSRVKAQSLDSSD